uniref:Uncharacterized protein n=1 Tax=Setaria italica TaxID=4555 RepID=K3YFP9_SETIT
MYHQTSKESKTLEDYSETATYLARTSNQKLPLTPRALLLNCPVASLNNRRARRNTATIGPATDGTATHALNVNIAS